MSQRLFTRVAVVQLAYHPAILLANRSPLEDPLGTDESLRVLDDLPGTLTERVQALRARIRDTYLAQFRKKLVAVLDFCRRSDVRLVVFPEYAVPWQVLGDVVQASGQMVVVAGTHTVERESRKSGIYTQLGASNPAQLSAVCPVLYRGRALALHAKLNPAKPESGHMKPGTSWSPIALPDGLPGPMGALVCLDFLYRESPAHQRLVQPQLDACRFLVVPSLTPTHSLGEFAAKSWEEARRYGRPVLYCDTAGLSEKEGGGTSIFVDEGHPSDLRSFPDQVGYLDRGEEGVIVADVDLGHVRVGESTRYDWERPVRAFAAASLLYGFHPADLRYKRWRKETESLLCAEDDDAVETLSQRVEKDAEIIQNAAAIGGPSRARRLCQLVQGHARLQTSDDFQKRLREVELPDDVLPLPVLRGAMAGAVSDVLFDWQRETRDPKLAELSARLRKAAEATVKDRAERSEPGTQSIGHIREAVIGSELQRNEPAPTVLHRVQQVLPTGIDPAILGVQKANGLTLRFAASVADLWMNSLRSRMDGREQLDDPPSDGPIKIVKGVRASDLIGSAGGVAGLKVVVPLPQGVSPSKTDTKRSVFGESVRSYRNALIHAADSKSLVSVDSLLLLARAEGREPRAVVSFDRADGENENILPRQVFVIVRVGAGWELWFAKDDGPLDIEQTDCERALQELGFSLPRFVPVAVGDVETRLRSLLALFHGQNEQLRRHRDLKLHEVAGHFVDLQVLAGEEPQPGLRALDSWLDGNEQTALLLGEFGSGKSTLLAEWCWRRSGGGLTPLPILVDLARAPATADGLDLLLWTVGIEPDAKAGKRARAALELLIQHQLILPCFDGFDEMATRAGDLNPASRLAALLRVATGGGRVILTSRDHYFSTQSELEQTTQATLRETLGSSAGHRILRVLPLTKGQIAELVNSTLSDAQKSQHALSRIANTYDLTDLVQRPLLLAMVLQSLDRIQPGARVAPADVYEAYVQKWLAQTREDDGSLPRDQKVRFAEALAEQLWRSGESSCTWQMLRQSVRNRIGQVQLPDTVPDAAAFLDVQGGAFFVREGEDRYRFAHKSFLEYFLSRALVRTLPQHPEEALNTRPVTAEVASFVGELLKREGDPQESAALRGLLKERELSDSGRSAKQSEVARENALRLLVGLARWSGRPVGWIPAGADLRGLRLWKMDLHEMSLRGVRLADADLSGADLTQADLTGADLSNVRLVGAKLSDTKLDGANAEGADFSLVSADRCSLQGATLRFARLTQSVWTHCNWQDSNLEGAELTRAGIWGASTDPTALPVKLAALSISSPSVSVVPRYSWWLVHSLAWCPDGSLFAAGQRDGSVSIWDATSGCSVATLQGHVGEVLSVAWSEDGSSLASGSSDRTVRLWDAKTGEALATLEGHEDKVWSVALSKDGSRLVSGSDDRTVRLWDTKTGEALATLEGHEGKVLSVAWSDDGSKLVSASSDRTVRLWDAKTGEALATLEGHEGKVLSVAWSDDGSKLVSASSDRTVRIWDATSGCSVATLQGHVGEVLSVAWSEDGSSLASGSSDRTVRLWDAKTGEALATLEGHEDIVWSVALSKDGSRLVSGSDDRTVRLWDAKTGSAIATLRGHDVWLNTVAWSEDGNKLVSGSTDPTLRLWDAKTGETLAMLRGHEGGILSVAWSKDGSKLVSGSSDSTLRLWDANTGEALATLRGHLGGVWSVAWSEDGSKLVSGSDDRTVRLWDAKTGAALATLEGHEDIVWSVALSKDGSRLVSGSDDRTVRLWDAKTGAALATLEGHEGEVLSVAWSEDGSRLVSGSSDRTLRLWDAETNEALTTLRGHEGKVWSVAWSEDGSKLASGSSDRTVRLWDAHSGESMARLRGHEGGVWSVAWSQDGSKLVSGSSDRTVRLWDAKEGRPIAALWVEGTHHLALLPTGFYRSSADAEGELSLALQAPRAPQSNFYLPLTSGLRSFFNRPDYVEAALAGRPPTMEQRNVELLAAGFSGGTAWDGQPHRVPTKTLPLPIEEPRDKNQSLRNPFRPGPAQDDVQRLPGRDEVVAELQSLIGSRSPAVLIGPRRSGKTSILRLLNRQRSPERRVLLITLEGKQIQTGDDLARLLASQLGLARLPDSSEKTTKTPRQHVVDQLQALRPQPLFLFDEVIHLQDGDATLFPWLRALGQDLAAIVYAGSPLDWVRVVQRAAKVAPGSSFGNDVTPVKLGPMSESDALRFLLDTSQGQIPESAARWVIEICGPWPFYLQVMGHALFECVRTGQRKPLLDRGAFRDLYEQRLLSDRSASFTGRWEEVPAPVRALLLQPESLLQRPVFLEQPQSIRRQLVEIGLCAPQGVWLTDRPFFDWISTSASLLSSES